MGQRPRSIDPTYSVAALLGVQIRNWRVQRGFSQAQLGRLVHVSGALIARIEKAERKAFPDLVKRLDIVLEAGGDLTKLVETLQTHEHDLTSLVGPTAKAAHHEAVAGLREVLAGLRRVDHSLGSGTALATVLAQAQVAEHLLLNASPGPARLEVLSLLGEVHQLAGWMEFDRGEISAADASLGMARRFAEEANDASLVAYIVGPSHGFVTTMSGHPGLGRERCELALRWARQSGNRRLTAFVLAVGARAEARLGEASRCLELLDAAGEELAGHDNAKADPVWLSVFDEAALRGHRGSCLLDLGWPENAIHDLREQEAEAPELFVRNRAIWLLDRADAHLSLDDVDAACDGIQQAWETAAGTSSRRILDRMTTTVSALDRWRAIPAVTDLRNRIRVPA